MQYLRGLELAQRDPDWTKKIVIAGLLVLSSACIPFFGMLAVMGWSNVIAQRAVRGEVDQLPRLELDLDYLITLAGSGFKFFVVRLVWSLAFLPVMVVFYAGFFLGMSSIMEGSTALGAALIAGSVLLLVVSAFPFGVLMACAQIRTQVSDDLSAGLEWGAVWEMARQTWKELLLGSLVHAFVAIAMSLVGLLLCCVGAYFVMALMMVITTHFQVAVYQAYVAQGGASVPVAHIPAADPPGSSTGPRPHAF